MSHDPIQPEKLDGLFLCDSGIAVVLCPTEECAYPHRQISMRRFVATAGMKGIREELNYAERMRRAMLAGAVEALDAVRQAHFHVEELYIQAMDFEAKEAFTKKFCETLFHLQNEE